MPEVHKYSYDEYIKYLGTKGIIGQSAVDLADRVILGKKKKDKQKTEEIKMSLDEKDKADVCKLNEFVNKEYSGLSNEQKRNLCWRAAREYVKAMKPKKEKAAKKKKVITEEVKQ
jgi:subtilase family serine protease